MQLTLNIFNYYGMINRWKMYSTYISMHLVNSAENSLKTVSKFPIFIKQTVVDRH